ncbi:MAG: translation initiation factor IF-2 [Paludibacteraceae bacterium]|nr:translation initiation factor IF-2 [Paludibacteraceae bacterium]
MAIKLIKACKELNIGVKTATDFLTKQGMGDFSTNDPNMRIDDDTYLLLAKQFNRDMALKIEADRIQKERQEREKLTTVSIPKEETEKPHIKEIGFIDLDKLGGKKAAETEQPQTEQEENTPTNEEEKEVQQQETIEPQPVVAEPQPEPEPKEPEVEVDNQPEEPAEEPAQTNEDVEEYEEEGEEEEEEEVITEEPQPEPEEEEIFKIKRHNMPKQPVVLGTIDLDNLNQSTRPKSKTKEQKKREREERRQQHQNQNQGQQGKQQNEKNQGNNQGEKKKRERIKQGKVDVAKEGANQKAKKAAKRPIKVEISEEEVQRQIKETIARLQGNKGKSKGAKYRKEKREHIREHQEELMEQEAAQSKVLKLTEFVTANELATMMNISVMQVISTCMSLGLMVSINQRLDAETINIVAEEFGFETEFVSAQVVQSIEDDTEDYSDEDLESRAPIVTVMGHVDHGKTSLLDHIRNANVIAGEAGGITQHIGAYNVKLKNGRHITFLDTPGHEAFTAMRARGAKVTDIAIIIVAADDNVMPQTVEAINHASAAGVPIIFAINKIDKPGANPEKIKEELANMNYLVEDWGGKYQSQEISAKKGTGVFELLEKVLLEADMLDLKANPKRRAKGSIIESSLDKGRGYVATVLVSDGTLHQGDIILAGTAHGRVKAMFNERNQKIKEVLPGEPALILGLNGAPQAGDEFNVMQTEHEAREIANKREQLQREQSIRTKKHVGLEEIGRRLAIGDFKELNIIVKADVDGSVEALSDSLIKLSTENIQVNVIHKAVGAISDSDILLAAASDAIIVGFNVRPTATAKKLADREEIDVRVYSIIYDAIEEIKSAMEGMLSPDIKEEVTGTLEVRQVFKITKVGMIAGCIVRDGKIKRSSRVRVIRDGIVIYTGDLASLKREKDDVKEVGLNTECGVNIRSYNDIQPGDLIEAFDQIEVAKSL